MYFATVTTLAPRLLALTLIWSASFTVAAAEGESPQAPDRIFFNGSVITVDGANRIVDALAVKDGRILEVGDAAAVRRLAGASTVMTDLAGKTLMPGFVDAHSHFLGVGTVALYEADLNSPPIGQVRSIDDIVRILAERAKSVPTGGTIVGRGYDDTLLAERRHPNRHDLDRASTRHRIIIRHVSGHFSAANSRAIEESGLTRATPTPEGGVIRRESDGTPSGVFEESAMSLVKRGPDAVYGTDRQLAAARRATDIYAAQGVTTAQHGSTDKQTFKVLQSAKKQGLIPLRLVVLPNGALADAIPVPVQPVLAIEKGLVLGPVKLFADGSIQGYTGYLSEPYHVPPEGERDYRGYPSQPCERLETRVSGLVRRGWQVAIHGNGDAAIDCILGAFEKAKPTAPFSDYRPVVIHAQTTRPDQLDRMKKIGATPSFFSLHTYFWGDRHRDQFLGPKRAAQISPTHSALIRGVPFSVHTDSPVVPVDQIRLLWATVNRVTTSGEVLGPEERVSVADALRAMTYNAAYQYGLESRIGSLEAGKLADLVILSDNPFAIDPLTLDRLQVLETVVGGRTVFLKRGSP